jgi:hypothetical protein
MGVIDTDIIHGSSLARCAGSLTADALVFLRQQIILKIRNPITLIELDCNAKHPTVTVYCSSISAINTGDAAFAFHMQSYVASVPISGPHPRHDSELALSNFRVFCKSSFHVQASCKPAVADILYPAARRPK